MKFVHSEATLSQVHSNIWMMTDLLPDGARASRVLLTANGRAAADQSHRDANRNVGRIIVSTTQYNERSRETRGGAGKVWRGSGGRSERHLETRGGVVRSLSTSSEGARFVTKHSYKMREKNGKNFSIGGNE